MSLFVTGTDTDAGKTWVSAAIIRHLRALGVDAVGMKPIACGGREDAEQLHAASEQKLSIGEVNPVWLRPAVAPYTASMIEERVVDLPLIRETFALLQQRHAAVIVEGAGGWLVPITRDYAVRDLAADLDLPVIVVAANKLGVLNHALLTVENIKARGVQCAGVVLNQISSETDAAAVTNPGILEELLTARSVPYLGEMEHGSQELPRQLRALLDVGKK